MLALLRAIDVRAELEAIVHPDGHIPIDFHWR